MNHFVPLDTNFKKKVQSSFDRQKCMTTLGIEISRIEPGEVELVMLYSPSYTQQHGFMHAGIISTALDSACGYAAFSLMPVNAAVLTVEYKINLLAPAIGDRFVFQSEVVKAGKMLTRCDARAYAITDAGSTLIANMSGTLMAVFDRKDIKD